MLKNLYTKITGDPNEKEIKRLTPQVEKINRMEPELGKLSDAELRAKTDRFKAQIAEATEDARARLTEAREQLDTAADADDRRMLEEHLKQAQKDLVAAERGALDAILPERSAAFAKQASARLACAILTC